MLSSKFVISSFTVLAKLKFAHAIFFHNVTFAFSAHSPALNHNRWHFELENPYALQKGLDWESAIY